jgi:hypothetical protein
MIVQRGFQKPESFHSERLNNTTIGYLFRAGFLGVDFAKGAVASKDKSEDKVHPAIGRQLNVDEQWAIVAYLRALQLSQRVPAGNLRPDERAKIGAPAQEGGNAGH